jgi:hypothetical protein
VTFGLWLSLTIQAHKLNPCYWSADHYRSVKIEDLNGRCTPSGVAKVGDSEPLIFMQTRISLAASVSHAGN